MAEIIRGTTPTIKYTFNTVDVDDITKAVLTIKKCNAIVIERDLTTGTKGDNDITWTFTQEETLSIDGNAEAMLNWVTADGTRGASRKVQITFKDNHKEVVM